MKYIDELNHLDGKVVLLRAGLNVPLNDDGTVANDFRIRRALPTLRFLHEQGAKTIIIAHIGRNPRETLAPVAAALNEHVPTTFATREELDTTSMREGDVVLLENLRQDERESANDDTLAQELAALADIFVQDAFSVCHREHASIVGIPKHIESYGGLLLKAEVSVLTRAREPEHPALFVLGGAKFKTKEPLIRQALDMYDAVFVGGALQNEILAAHGKDVGASIIEDGIVPSDILEHANLRAVSDVVIDREGEILTASVDAVSGTDVIVDIGSGTIDALTKELSQYKTIVWNGPLGWYEKGHVDATLQLARAVSGSEAETTVGGGDSVAVLQLARLDDEFDFVSTGGGAMLQFLQDGTLPGLEALK